MATDSEVCWSKYYFKDCREFGIEIIQDSQAY